MSHSLITKFVVKTVKPEACLLLIVLQDSRKC